MELHINKEGIVVKVDDLDKKESGEMKPTQIRKREADALLKFVERVCLGNFRSPAEAEALPGAAKVLLELTSVL